MPLEAYQHMQANAPVIGAVSGTILLASGQHCWSLWVRYKQTLAALKLHICLFHLDCSKQVNNCNARYVQRAGLPDWLIISAERDTDALLAYCKSANGLTSIASHTPLYSKAEQHSRWVELGRSRL